MEMTETSLNQRDSGVSVGLIDAGIKLIPCIHPSSLIRANEGAHEGAHVLFPSGRIRPYMKEQAEV